MGDNRDVFESAYDGSSYASDGTPGFFGDLLRERLELVRQLPVDARLLDLGCGDGAALLPLVREGREVVGLDYSKRILARLRDSTGGQGVAMEQLELIHGDARQMPCADASFDGVFSFSALYAMPDLERVLAEIHRVLKPGGIAILDLGNVRSLNDLEARRVGTGLESFHQTPARMRCLLGRAGFATIETRVCQSIPGWGGGNPSDCALNQRLAERFAGSNLDRRICSGGMARNFAFRHILVVEKAEGAMAVGPAAVVGHDHEALRAALHDGRCMDSARDTRRRKAVERAAGGDVLGAADRLLELLDEHPQDPAVLLSLGGLYTSSDHQRRLARWCEVGRRWLRRREVRQAWIQPTTPDRRLEAKAPEVSVVLPTYQHADLLGGAIDSVLAQTHEDLELIVVDDGSTDHTAEVLARYRDPRVHIVRQENRGLPAALNAGFARARGARGLTWTSADNRLHPTMIAELLAALDAEPEAVMSIGGFRVVDDAGRELDRHTERDTTLKGMLANNNQGAAFLYRAGVVGQVGAFDEALLGAEDWDFALRMLDHGPAVRVDRVLYDYRVHERSMTAAIPERVREASRGVIRKWWSARDEFLEFAELYPGVDRGEAALDLGERLLHSPFWEPDAALQCLREAQRRDAEPVRTAAHLAVALLRLGDLEQGGALVQALSRLPSPEISLWAQRAIMAIQVGDPSAVTPLPRARAVAAP